jgi:hypothetical protein
MEGNRKVALNGRNVFRKRPVRVTPVPAAFNFLKHGAPSAKK